MKTDGKWPYWGYQALSIVCHGLFLAEIVLVFISWILSAMMLGGVRSLLSSEGIRWFFSNFTSMLASPLLVWLIVSLVAVGCIHQSGLLTVVGRAGNQTLHYRDRTALRLATVLLVVYVVLILMLTVIPHAILLSVSGELFPSAFSRSLVPVVAFGIILVSVSFGVMSGRFTTLSDVMASLSFGIQKGAPLFVLYILAVQLYESLHFVFYY